MLILIALFIYIPNVEAKKNKEYVIGDNVYYNPVKNEVCNYTKYWTTSHQKGYCYRFLVIEKSEKNNDTLKVMLDHNITADTFKKYESKLEKAKKKWERYDGKIDIITEKDVVKILNIDKKINLY